MTVVRRFITESGDIMFEGNGYSREWEEEAQNRGLKAVRNVPEAYEIYHDPTVIELFDSMSVLAPNEVEARFDICEETADRGARPWRHMPESCHSCCSEIPECPDRECQGNEGRLW